MNSLPFKLSVIGLTGLIYGFIPQQSYAIVCPAADPPPCVNTGDITDGQVIAPDIGANAVTNVKIGAAAVTTPKIAANAVTGAQVAPNSLNESDFTVARRLVVAGTGGDFTTVSAALNAISPSAGNPFVIDVMPGTYVENITMKNFVHLRGAGREVTTITSPSAVNDVITLFSIDVVRISGLTISGGNSGILNVGSSPVIVDCSLISNTFGIQNQSPTSPAPPISAPLILNNFIVGNGEGIRNLSSVPTIRGNTIVTSGRGIFESASLSTIEDNDISGYTEGIRTSASSAPLIVRNQITDSAAAFDLIVEAGTTPKISYNVYDAISGFSGTGLFNVNSNGMAAPAP